MNSNNKIIKPCTHLFFEVLSNPLRIEIVQMLIHKPRRVSEICKELNVEQSRISHALTALMDCQLVKYTKEGKSRIYQLSTPIVENIIKMVVEYEQKICSSCNRLARR